VPHASGACPSAAADGGQRKTPPATQPTTANTTPIVRKVGGSRKACSCGAPSRATAIAGANTSEPAPNPNTPTPPIKPFRSGNQRISVATGVG
jgi:hypothetical protein